MLEALADGDFHMMGLTYCCLISAFDAIFFIALCSDAGRAALRMDTDFSGMPLSRILAEAGICGSAIADAAVDAARHESRNLVIFVLLMNCIFV